MSRPLGPRWPYGDRFPRVSGDEPDASNMGITGAKFSPRERG